MAERADGPEGGRGGLRASDADRQAVADRLMRALDEGRLTLTEYDERVRQAYGARTYAELDGLLDDLPPVQPAGSSQLATASGATVDRPPVPGRPAGGAGAAGDVAPRGRYRHGLSAAWSGWFTVVMINVVIWALVAMSSGATYFWPIWIAGPWGAVLLARTISGRVAGPRRPAGVLPGATPGRRRDDDPAANLHQELRRQRWEEKARRRAERFELKARRYAERRDRRARRRGY